MNFKTKHVKALSGAACLVTLVGGGFVISPAVASAQPQSSETPIALTANQGATVRDVDGNELTTLTDSDELGERVVTAALSDGSTARVTVQSAPVDSLAGLRENQDVAVSADFVDAEPEPVVEEVSSELITDDQGQWETTTSFATTPTTASFRWDQAENGFTASLSGGPTSASEDGTVAFTGLAPNSDYEVVLEGVVDTGFNDESALVSQKTIQLHTTPAANSQAREFGVQTYQAFTTAYVHKTFIPPATVDGSMCNWGNKEYTFRGDNRSYKQPAPATPYAAKDYRTMMFANINWDNPAPYTVITVKDVGQSVTLKNGVTAHASYAPTDQMKFEAIQSGGAYAQLRLNHSAANPHCQILDVNYGGAIRYEETVRFYRSGTVEVVGYRRAAPAHEMYARFSNSAGTEQWIPLLQRPNQGFKCLIEALCALDSYSKTTNW